MSIANYLFLEFPQHFFQFEVMIRESATQTFNHFCKKVEKKYPRNSGGAYVIPGAGIPGLILFVTFYK